jgi:hypothetical protein
LEMMPMKTDMFLCILASHRQMLFRLTLALWTT